MIIRELTEEIEKIYPKKNAEEWDNVGLLIGDSEENINGIIVTLDIDEKSIELAKQNKVNLIISHHPLIFKGIKNINYKDALGRKIKEIIKNDINILCLHTNVDSTLEGLNDYILKKIGIEKSKILVPNFEKKSGIGRYYKMEKDITIDDYCKELKRLLQLERMDLYAENVNKICKKIAFINGAGAEFWKKAKFYQCDLIVTGDVKYHVVQEALENGMAILDLGHYESEKEFLNLMEETIKKINKDVVIYKNTCKVVKAMLY